MDTQKTLKQKKHEYMLDVMHKVRQERRKRRKPVLEIIINKISEYISFSS